MIKVFDIKIKGKQTDVSRSELSASGITRAAKIDNVTLFFCDKKISQKTLKEKLKGLWYGEILHLTGIEPDGYETKWNIQESGSEL
jgi:hypothetical protein